MLDHEWGKTVGVHHCVHQPPDTLGIDLTALFAQAGGHPPVAIGRRLEALCVKTPH